MLVRRSNAARKEEMESSPSSVAMVRVRVAVILGHTKDRDVKAHLSDNRLDCRHMPLAAVQQDQVGQVAKAHALLLVLAVTLQAAGDDLPH